MSKKRKAAVNFILITIVIDIIGFGIIIPVLPELLAQMQNISINNPMMWKLFIEFNVSLTN